MLFMGIDLGTQGVRAVVTDEHGALAAQKSVTYQESNVSSAAGRHEQRPSDWWRATCEVISHCTAQLGGAAAIGAISVDGTSGTVIPLDAAFAPLGDAIMYDDARAGAEANYLSALGAEHEGKMGLAIGASFAVSRVKWLQDNEPGLYEKTRVFAHQADYIVGKLCGVYDVSDYSNALKMGYDLIDGRWPDFISRAGIDTDKLPAIVAPGEPIARVSLDVARELGLSTQTLVVGGSTDGYASSIAAGVRRAGDWASILGTTLVLKGATEALMVDPTGSSYSHRLPSGEWLIGGASNIGGRCLNEAFDPARFQALDTEAEKRFPTGALIYPLTGKGERFPFKDPEAQCFVRGDVSDERVYYAALMEGVAFVERLAFDRMVSFGCSVGDMIYTAGGACKSAVWLKIRASVLGKSLCVPAHVDAAMGSAMIAASGRFGGLAPAVTAMFRASGTVEPDPAAARRYDELYEEFLEECRRRYHLGI